MKNQLIVLMERVRSSYWFIPGLMALLAAILSIITIELDKSLEDVPAWVIRLVYVDSAESARAVLSTAASSMITVAGVVFSLTMVVLSLTSQQYGPLVLYRFMKDRGNQFVLGIFTSTFVFCLLILRTIRGTEDNLLVPHISVMTGLGLSIVSLAMLIYFIHHVAESIQSTNIIARVSGNLLQGIETIFPEALGHAEEAHEQGLVLDILERFDSDSKPLWAPGSGYLQIVDDDKLFDVAKEYDLVIRIVDQPGHFFIEGDLIAQIVQMKPVNQAVADEIQSAFVFGVDRTENQDIKLMLIQLVSIGVRALSPGINDPYTAITCIDYITEALIKLLKRRMPSRYRYDDANHLRVISDPLPFEALFHTALDQLRHYGKNDVKVVMHLLTSVNRLAKHARENTHLQLFDQYIAALYKESRTYFTNPIDVQQLDRIYLALQQNTSAL